METQGHRRSGQGAHGAERYVRSKRRIFLDKERRQPLPISIPAHPTIHKVIVAHGAEEACKRFSPENINGSLGISYRDSQSDDNFPFMVPIDKASPVHIFDSYNLPVVLSEIDTVQDFSWYLDAKVDAISRLDLLSYAGEEDLLAHYFGNFDDNRRRHFIGVSDTSYNALMIGEGEWTDFVRSKPYKRRKAADESSYMWDKLIEKTCKSALSGTLIGPANAFDSRSAIQVMASEPRFSRRVLVELMRRAIRNFPEVPTSSTRMVSFWPSFQEHTAYVFLQLHIQPIHDYEGEYRTVRRRTLEIACGAAKNKFANLKTIAGIAIDAPRFSHFNSEDFLLLDCKEWPDDRKKKYEHLNEQFAFFKSDSLRANYMHVQEFPNPDAEINSPFANVGPNVRCPCGSGRKFKKCCLQLGSKQ